MLRLTMHFNPEKIGKWQRFDKNFELSGTSSRARPVINFCYSWQLRVSTMLRLTMHFNPEKIGKWQRFDKNFELSGTSRNRKLTVFELAVLDL